MKQQKITTKAKVATSKKHCNWGIVDVNPNLHRRILSFMNDAHNLEDLIYQKNNIAHETDQRHEDNLQDIEHKREKILDEKLASEVLKLKNTEYPLGFRNLRELMRINRFEALFERLTFHFGSSIYGQWDTFPQDIPFYAGYQGVVHAALLNSGKVLFISADNSTAGKTVLWNPNDTSPTSFNLPTNQPDYSQLCGHHVFLSDGNLLSMGGGGYGYTPIAIGAFKFDPATETWTRTSNNMSEAKWYPTAVALGDKRVLVVCGDRGGDMDIYDEATDTFSPVTSGDTRYFPNLYPGLHLLPNHAIFYTRTGWGTAGPAGSATNDNQSAYFTLTGSHTGVWNNINSASVNRAKGISVMLLSNSAPYVRLMVLGGVDNSTNNTYEIIDASILSPTASWSAPIPFPDGEHRSLCSAVLLPDGNLFVCGGIQSPNSPCTMFNPQTNSWSPMANLPGGVPYRDYHSVAILLPSGKVMMAGWESSEIHVYSPPYLFNGPRPTISIAPNLVHHGQQFTIESPDAASIVKVVLVRPMAVTHQTDSEQKVLEMPYIHDHVNPTRLKLTAPHGGHPHSIAQQGHYMMFVVNNNGVPSVATWIYLH